MWVKKAICSGSRATAQNRRNLSSDFTLHSYIISYLKVIGTFIYYISIISTLYLADILREHIRAKSDSRCAVYGVATGPDSQNVSAAALKREAIRLMANEED